MLIIAKHSRCGLNESIMCVLNYKYIFPPASAVWDVIFI